MGSLTPSSKSRATASSQKGQSSAFLPLPLSQLYAAKANFQESADNRFGTPCSYSVSIHIAEALPQEQHIENMRASITVLCRKASHDVQKQLSLPSTLQLKQGYHLEKIAPLSSIPATESCPRYFSQGGQPALKELFETVWGSSTLRVLSKTIKVLVVTKRGMW